MPLVNSHDSPHTKTSPNEGYVKHEKKRIIKIHNYINSRNTFSLQNIKEKKNHGADVEELS